MAQRKDETATKKKILSACVRLFFEQGYNATTVSKITKAAGVSRGSFQNIFPAKEEILLELAQTMVAGQLGAARSIAAGKVPSSVYVYDIETALQLTMTELNENLRDIYIEAYTSPVVLKLINVETAKEL